MLETVVFVIRCYRRYLLDLLLLITCFCYFRDRSSFVREPAIFGNCFVQSSIVRDFRRDLVVCTSIVADGIAPVPVPKEGSRRGSAGTSKRISARVSAFVAIS